MSFPKNKTHHGTEQEIQELKQKLEEKSDMLETAATIGKQLVDQNDQMQAKIIELEDQCKGKDSDIKQIQREVNLLTNACQELENDNMSLIQQINELKNENHELIETNKMIKKMSTPTPKTNNKFDFDSLEDMYNQTVKERDLLLERLNTGLCVFFFALYIIYVTI